MTFTYRPISGSDGGAVGWPVMRAEYGGGVIAMNERGVVAGHLRWYRPDHGRYPNQIAQVTVYAEFRRRGIATRLLREAQKINPDIRHSEIRTLDGDVWAKSTGDPILIRYWQSQYRLAHVDLIFEDFKHIIENESSWENPAWTGKNSSGATSGSPSPNRKSATSTVTTPPTRTASTSKKYA